MTRLEAITEITRRIVAECQPVRVYLFGSAVRGEDGPDSDLDFLVVLPDDAPAAFIRGDRLTRSIWGVHAADIIPWCLSDFEGRAEHVAASLPATVAREGKCSMTPAQWLPDETRRAGWFR